MSGKGIENEARHLGRLDRVGMTASILCAIHCVGLGFLAGILPLVGTAITLNWIWELVFTLSAILIGGYTMFRSRSIHGRPLPMLLLFVGIFILLSSKIPHLFFEPHHVHHGMHVHLDQALLSACGGVLIAAAHLVNLRFRAACSAH